MPKITVGRIVHYRLSAGDVRAIMGQREQLATALGVSVAAIGNTVAEGDVVAALVARVFDERSGTANLQVTLDGRDSYWATSRSEGTAPGTWAWPKGNGKDN